MNRENETPVHAIVVIIVVLSATILTGLHDLDATTLSTVYGAALGFASGLVVGNKRPDNSNGHS